MCVLIFLEFEDSGKITCKAMDPDSRFSLRTGTHFFFSKLTIQNTFLSHIIEKSFKIIEDIRIAISGP